MSQQRKWPQHTQLFAMTKPQPKFKLSMMPLPSLMANPPWMIAYLLDPRSIRKYWTSWCDSASVILPWQWTWRKLSLWYQYLSKIKTLFDSSGSTILMRSSLESDPWGLPELSLELHPVHFCWTQPLGIIWTSSPPRILIWLTSERVYLCGRYCNRSKFWGASLGNLSPVKGSTKQGGFNLRKFDTNAPLLQAKIDAKEGSVKRKTDTTNHNLEDTYGDTTLGRHQSADVVGTWSSLEPSRGLSTVQYFWYCASSHRYGSNQTKCGQCYWKVLWFIRVSGACLIVKWHFHFYKHLLYLHNVIPICKL